MVSQYVKELSCRVLEKVRAGQLAPLSECKSTTLGLRSTDNCKKKIKRLLYGDLPYKLASRCATLLQCYSSKYGCHQTLKIILYLYIYIYRYIDIELKIEVV